MRLPLALIIVLLIVLYSLPAFAARLDSGKPVHGSIKGFTAWTCWYPQKGLSEFCIFYKERS